MDPAVLGTLRIGLDAIDAETHPRARRPPVGRTHPTSARLRTTMAALLRRIADVLEPRAVGGASPEAS